MKKSELIKILQEHIEQHGDGDVEIEYWSGDCMGSLDQADILKIFYDEKEPEVIVLSVENRELKGSRVYVYK